MASDLVDTGFPQFAKNQCRAGEYAREEWIVPTLVSELDVAC